jgi:hypothetical protein
MRRARGDDQVVIGYFTVLRMKNFLFRINALYFLHQHSGVALGTQDVADRPGNISRR